MIKAKVSEAKVLSSCLTFLRLHRIYAWRNNTGACKAGQRLVFFGRKGSSDIIGIAPDGRFLAIECKRPQGGTVSNEQSKFLSEIAQRGGVAIVVHSTEELAIKLAERGVI